MIGIGRGMKEVFAMISKVAPLDCNISFRATVGLEKSWWQDRSIEKADAETGPSWHLTAPGSPRT